MIVLSIPKTRSRSRGDYDPIYQALLLILAGQPDRVAWSAFSSADWNLLRATARAEGVAPLLHYALDAVGWPAELPFPLRRELRSSYYATAAQNLLLYRELARILTALPPSPQLLVIVLKGAVLATTLYPNIALRPLNDLDLLIPRQYLESVVEAVQSLGYREVHPEMAPEFNRIAGHHVLLRGGPWKSISLELHWSLVAGDSDWRSPPLDWFWSQTEPFNLSVLSDSPAPLPPPNSRPPAMSATSAPLLTLTPTAHLLYLAAHLMLQHGGAQARLLWFYDIHLLVSRCESWLDWDELLDRAHKFRWTPVLHAALRGTQDRFATPMPYGFLDVLAETHDRQVTRLVERKAGPVQTRGVRTWDHLITKDWPARLRLAWGIACPSPTYIRWRYKPRPMWLWPLCYPYRWFDILREGLSTVGWMASSRWPIGRSKH